MKTFKRIYQECYDEIRPDRGLVKEMLEEARTWRREWMRYAVMHMVLRPAAIVLLGLMVLFGGVSVLASNSGYVYRIIERISPELADVFVPVQESSTRAGICMEVEAIYLENGDKTATVLLSFRDTLGDRIQGQVDLFDSYGLDASAGASWVSGGCGYVGYDEETGKAYFRVQLDSDAAYERNKLTFRVRELLLSHEEEDREVPLDFTPGMSVKRISLNGRGGMMDWDRYGEWMDLDMEEPAGFMEKIYIKNTESMPDDPRSSGWVLDGIPVSQCAEDDFTVTGLAYEDNVLRLQICRGELSHASRYVIPYLKMADGSERIYWFSTHWSEKKGEKRLAFEEYYLPCTPEELEGARLYGEFCRIEDPLEGNWKVTFRVEEKAGGRCRPKSPFIFGR